MASIRGMLPTFELLQPATIDDALALLNRHSRDAWVLAGGLDTLDGLFDGVHEPPLLIDIGGIPQLKGVQEAAGGIEIGATTTLTEVARHPVVRARFDLLRRAAEAVGSPQIRNQGTMGGNVSQGTRCSYFRSGWMCYRAGGNVCYAETPTGMNKEHAIFGTSRCMAVNPSDTAPALIALGAAMVIRSTKGERVVDAEDYFISPSTDITRMTTLGPGDLLTAIRIPGTWAGARFYFEKISERKSWDFPLVNIASAMRVSNGRIDDARVAVNAVAARPLRLRAVEDEIRGKQVEEAVGGPAADFAVRGAKPLRYNAYKIPLMKNLVRRAIRGGVGAV